MKNSSYLILLLAVALVFVSYKWVTSTGNDDTFQPTTIEDIMTRASVRSYTDQPVEPATVDTLLRAAMAAPTARNMQPWRFIVVDNRGLLDTIAANFGSMKMAAEAPLAIIMCGDMADAMDGEGRDYWVQDVSAATENLLLAAHASGLGAVWCGIYPIAERVAQFSELFDLPESIIPLACVCIGYPNGITEPKDKWQPFKVSRNNWSTPYY